MDGTGVPERYVRLCLAVDAHVEDLVDAYVGPQHLRDQMATEGARDPRELHDEAVALLADIPRADLSEDRIRWLRAQATALECVTARLAGDDIPWAEEVERCFSISPPEGDEEEFRGCHARLDAALPGSGDLAPRYHAWLEAATVPSGLLERALDVFTRMLRRRAHAIAGLPPDEGVEYEVVTGVPWQAYNRYEGDFRSRIEISGDLPWTLDGVIDIVAHEAYPGHHAERACKDRILFRQQGRFETCVAISHAPEAVVTEGLAVNALEGALGDEGFAALQPAIDELGLAVDAGVLGVVHVESWRLFAAGTNAARMLHEGGVGEAEAQAYLETWTLDPPERVAKTVEFLTDPGSRTYASVYTAGRRLCRAFLERESQGFRRLLTEQLTVASLLPEEA